MVFFIHPFGTFWKWTTVFYYSFNSRVLQTCLFTQRIYKLRNSVQLRSIRTARNAVDTVRTFDEEVRKGYRESRFYWRQSWYVSSLRNVVNVIRYGINGREICSVKSQLFSTSHLASKHHHHHNTVSVIADMNLDLPWRNVGHKERQAQQTVIQWFYVFMWFVANGVVFARTTTDRTSIIAWVRTDRKWSTVAISDRRTSICHMWCYLVTIIITHTHYPTLI